jgi:hypothetical protein
MLTIRAEAGDICLRVARLPSASLNIRAKLLIYSFTIDGLA